MISRLKPLKATIERLGTIETVPSGRFMYKKTLENEEMGQKSILIKEKIEAVQLKILKHLTNGDQNIQISDSQIITSLKQVFSTIDIKDSKEDTSSTSATVEERVIGDKTFIYGKTSNFLPRKRDPTSVVKPISSIDSVPRFSLGMKMGNEPVKVLTTKAEFDQAYENIVQNCSVIFMANCSHKVFTYRPFPSLLVIYAPFITTYIFDLLTDDDYLKSLENLLYSSEVVKVFYDETLVPMFIETFGLSVSKAIDMSLVYRDKSYYEKVLELGIPSSMAVVDWRIRPLNDRLIEIAKQSVRYLPNIAEKLTKEDPVEVIGSQITKYEDITYSYSSEMIEKDVERITQRYGDLDDKKKKYLYDILKQRDSSAIYDNVSRELILPDKFAHQLVLKESDDIEGINKLHYFKRYREEFMNVFKAREVSLFKMLLQNKKKPA